MLTRAITGGVYVVAIIGSIYLGGWYLHIFMGILALLALQEFASMFKKSAFSPNPILGPIIGFIIYLASLNWIRTIQIQNDPPTYLPLIIVSILGFSLISIVELYRKKKNPFVNIAISITSIIYIVLPLILINLITISENDEISHHVFPLMGIFIMIWCSDTFAYLVGRKIGKNKLFERISPNKSWEGFFGGMIFAIIAGIIIAYFLDEQPFIYYIFMGVLVSTFGTLGDLIESMLKRSLGLKDSGKILPGHGGILDRLDSVLIVIPFIFIYQLITFHYFG